MILTKIQQKNTINLGSIHPFTHLVEADNVALKLLSLFFMPKNW